MARVGDFYEFYYDQGRLVSQALSIRLAQRSRSPSKQPLLTPSITPSSGATMNETVQEKKDVIVFCGFPSSRGLDYVRVLLDQGYSVAKWEQYERVQANGQTVLVREVDRIFTPVRYPISSSSKSSPFTHIELCIGNVD
jgi:DNA mismatch repair ATPase MutS